MKLFKSLKYSDILQLARQDYKAKIATTQRYNLRSRIEEVPPYSAYVCRMPTVTMTVSPVYYKLANENYREKIGKFQLTFSLASDTRKEKELQIVHVLHG